MSAQLEEGGYSVMEAVNAAYTLPFQPYEFQRKAIEDLAMFDRSGWYAEPGCGKTLMGTVVALHKRLQHPGLVTFVIMPPILLNSWDRWLKTIGGAGRAVVYRGTPAERRALNLKGATFILMSMQIFKKDYPYLLKTFLQTPRMGIIDEAHSIKNPTSDNHKFVRDFFLGQHLALMTGTPVSNPQDAYGYIKLISPTIYRSKQQFLNLHVADKDFFGNVTAWKNLDLMQSNLLFKSCRMLKEEVLVGLKEPIYTPIYYQLEPAHMKLYDKLVREQLLEYESGKVIDATGDMRLRHAAQQIVCNWGHFAENDDLLSNAFQVLDNVISELGMDEGSGKKLLVFSLYKMTNRNVVKHLQKYGAVACYSEVSAAQQAKNVDRFLTDPTCQVLVAQPLSAGYGLNLQDVCHDVLFLEEPTTAPPFHQSVARVYREGQKNTPNVRLAIAEGTIQVRLHHQLLHNDALANAVQIGYKDLREVLYGAT